MLVCTKLVFSCNKSIRRYFYLRQCICQVVLKPIVQQWVMFFRDEMFERFSCTYVCPNICVELLKSQHVQKKEPIILIKLINYYY